MNKGIIKGSLLKTIKDKINEIDWTKKLIKERAELLCNNIFNLYLRTGGDFYQYKYISIDWIKKYIPSNAHRAEILKKLVENNVLFTNNSYNVGKFGSAHGKGYRFNDDLLNNNNIDYTIFVASIKSLFEDTIINNDLEDTTSFFDKYEAGLGKPFDIESKLKEMLEKVSIDNSVYNWINNFKLDLNDIKINEEIDLEWIEIIGEEPESDIHIKSALMLANKMNMDLILYKEKGYIDNLKDFILRKEKDLKIIYTKNIFDIENKNIRISRNKTNNRLDYNFTNMKSELLNFIRIDGEKLIEVDIANAQFSILSYITQDLDADFINDSINGKLYNSVGKYLNINKEEAKEKMFRIAFDKVKKEQDWFEELYPRTCWFINNYKKKNGYKAFSNLLQKAESNILIDGLMNYMFNKGLYYYPIHDAMRVKESEVEVIKKEIELWFEKINFNCLLRKK